MANMRMGLNFHTNMDASTLKLPLITSEQYTVGSITSTLQLYGIHSINYNVYIRF